MARQKRSSASLDKAQTRSGALASIDKQLDLGHSLTLTAYGTAIDTLENKLDEYNDKLSEVDALQSDLEREESKMDDLTERMLAGVGAKYGKDSTEYEKAGGVRKSERKRRTLATAGEKK